jgi:hypothetical protein
MAPTSRATIAKVARRRVDLETVCQSATRTAVARERPARRHGSDDVGPRLPARDAGPARA